MSKKTWGKKLAIHVVPDKHTSKWSVKHSGSQKLVKVFDTQREAKRFGHERKP